MPFKSLTFIENTIKPDLRVVSFVGADGVGKTTIAEVVKTNLERKLGKNRVALVKGGQQHTWNSLPEIKQNRLAHFLQRQQAGNLDTEKFFNHQAIIGYLYVKKLTQNGNVVILDSDPLGKRLMWQTLNNINPQFSFEKALTRSRRLLGGYFPGNFVYVHPGEDQERVSGDIRNLIKLNRGSFDPKDSQEVLNRLHAASQVSTVLKQRLPSLGVNIIDIANAPVNPGRLSRHIQELSDNLISQLRLQK
jgi:hypothetical protein